MPAARGNTRPPDAWRLYRHDGPAAISFVTAFKSWCRSLGSMPSSSRYISVQSGDVCLAGFFIHTSDSAPQRLLFYDMDQASGQKSSSSTCAHRPRAGLGERRQRQAGILGRLAPGAGIGPREQGGELAGQAAILLQPVGHQTPGIEDGRLPALAAPRRLIGPLQQMAGSAGAVDSARPCVPSCASPPPPRPGAPRRAPPSPWPAGPAACGCAQA